MTRRRGIVRRVCAAAAAVVAAGVVACDSDGPTDGFGLRGARLSAAIPDTVRGRALTLNVAATSPRSSGIVGLATSLDGGPFTVPGANTSNGGVALNRTSDTTWQLYVSEHLAPGSHVATVAAYDADGLVAQRSAPFESRIDTIPYHVDSLPTVGAASALALDINQAGIVAGVVTDAAGVPHPAIWTNGQLQQLPDNGSGIARALNDVGTVVGTAQDPRISRVCRRGVVWRSGGAPVLLPQYPAATPPSDTSSACYFGTDPALETYERASAFPVAVNDAGTILTGRYLDRGGVLTELVPGRQNRVIRWGLNERDQAVVSVSQGPTYEYNAAAAGLGVTVGLPTTGVSNYVGPGRQYTWVAGINDAGQVAGTREFFLSRAFVSDAAGHATDLGPLTGDLVAVALNNGGDVLLRSPLVQGGTTVEAYLLRGGRLAAIRMAGGWTLTGVTAFNDAGLVIGSATDAAGVAHAVLLRPGA